MAQVPERLQLIIFIRTHHFNIKGAFAIISSLSRKRQADIEIFKDHRKSLKIATISAL